MRKRMLLLFKPGLKAKRRDCLDFCGINIRRLQMFMVVENTGVQSWLIGTCSHLSIIVPEIKVSWIKYTGTFLNEYQNKKKKKKEMKWNKNGVSVYLSGTTISRQLKLWMV